MKKKLFTTISAIALALGSALSLSACDLFGGDDEKADATLYHLTLSSNLTLSEEEKAKLKATYGYGEPSPVVVEGVRDEDKIAALKDAGATDADIAKAGKRQSDGSYYFFDQDPIYIEYPEKLGYKMTGFYYKEDNKLAYNPIVSTNSDGNKYLTRWNMDAKDVELEARYQKWSYHPYFNTPSSDETNPNNLGDQYCYVDQGPKTLLPASSSLKHKHFKTWYYQKYVGDVWTRFDITELPADYYEESLRIEAEWEYDSITIQFAFELYIDPDTQTKLDFDDVFELAYAKGNLTKVNGVPTIGVGDPNPQDPGLQVTKDSEVKMSYSDSSSWLDFTLKAKPEYKLWRYKINDSIFETFNDDGSGQYSLSSYIEDYNGVEDSVILIQVTSAY